MSVRSGGSAFHFDVHSDQGIIVFNNGTANVKDIADQFQETFNVDLGQYRRMFLDIRTRKDDRAKFINTLKDKLLLRMEETDENF
jgi:hypothetical protein